MQLILDTEPALDIERNMSAEEDTQNGKVSNGNNIEDLNKKYIGNKENINIESIVHNADDSKKKSDESDKTSDNPPFALVTEQNGVESNDVENKEVDEKSCFKPDEHIDGEGQNKESQNSSTDKESNSTSNSKKEDISQEQDVEDDIINIAKTIVNKGNECIDIEFEKTDTTEENESLPENDAQSESEKDIPVNQQAKPVNNAQSCSVKDDLVNTTDHEKRSDNCLHNEASMESTQENDSISVEEVKETLKQNKEIESNLEDDIISVPDSQNCSGDLATTGDTSGESPKDIAPSQVVNKIEDKTDNFKISSFENETNIDQLDEEDINEDDIITIRDEVNSNQISECQKPETVQKETESTIPKEDPSRKDEIEIVEDAKVSNSKCDAQLPDEKHEDTPFDDEPSKIIEQGTKDKETLKKQDKSLCSSDVVLKDNQESGPIELSDDMDSIENESCSKESQNGNIKDVVPVKEAKTVDKVTDTATPIKETPVLNDIVDEPVICKLSNTLDILSDDDDEEETSVPIVDAPKPPSPVTEQSSSKQEGTEINNKDSNEKQCINLDDDDDIMVIDEDTDKNGQNKPVDDSSKETDKDLPTKNDVNTDSETGEKAVEEVDEMFLKKDEKELTPAAVDPAMDIDIKEKSTEPEPVKEEIQKPLLPDDFLKTAKKNLADMTREDLEEFCILRIVESIVDRSNLSEIKNKLKTMAQGIEEYRKKAMMLTKQNRDLQVVLKSVQEEQRKAAPGMPVAPLKITRSVGMQVYMEKSAARRKTIAQMQNNTTPNNRPRNMPISSPRPPKTPLNNHSIPVPRLVPANSPAVKTPTPQSPSPNTPPKTAVVMPNGVRNPSPNVKPGEKRPHSKMMAVTVDLTDDEPPAKINTKASPVPPVRLVSSQHLMQPQRQPFGQAVNSPRKVYIPISGQNQPGLRQTHAIMLKPVGPPGVRPRCPTQLTRIPANQMRVNRVASTRHPAPLPESTKQIQPPNWKALPPAPDLKLSKVENGIVISWKIEDYQEDSHEEIASYQLYAYQETSSPPSTALWKKIGDVKALPLPMACTLTQFMSGFKYYFAVRAVDIRSRLGPFSLPGSILLLNKL